MQRKKTLLGAGLLALAVSCATLQQKSQAQLPRQTHYDNSTVLVTDRSLEQMVNSAYQLDATIAYVSTDNAMRANQQGHGTTFVGDTHNNRQYFITANHVVDSEEQLINPFTGTQLFPDSKNTHYTIQVNGRTHELDLVRENEENDIAILRSRTDLRLQRRFNFASRNLNPGDSTYSVGFPFNIGRYLTSGTIAQVNGNYFKQTAPTNPGNCLTPETKIFTTEGPKEIQHVQEGDFVFSLDEETKKLVHSKVLRKIKNENKKEIFNLKTKTREVRLSDNHPVLKVSRRKIGEKNVRLELQWEETKNIKKDDVVVILKKQPDYTTIIEIEGKPITSDFMRFCGFYIGDGYSRYRPAYGGEVHLYVFNEQLEKEYQQIIENVFDKKPTIQKGTLTIHSVEAAKKVDTLGITGYSYSKDVPGWVFQTSTEMKKAFLQGYFESDGHYRTRDRCWQLEAVSEKLIKNLKLLCIQVGYRCTNVRTRQREPRCIGNNNKISKVRRSFMLQVYTETQKKFQTLAQKKVPYHLISDEFTFDRVCSKNLVEESETYDLEIENTHNFIAEGILVHNSGGPIYVLRLGIPEIAGIAQTYRRSAQGIFTSVMASEFQSELEEAIKNDKKNH